MKTFSEKIIEIVEKIPKGETLTYKGVAEKAGNAKAARAVGNILNRYYRFCDKNGMDKIPCHRVVRSDGRSGGYVLGEKKKRDMLRKESLSR
ncbi:MAG: MGMT family protein [Candidatus Moranbacteria bacterium]|nr:MGMT family protein [Candidatus Moranbacteria bacterium]